MAAGFSDRKAVLKIGDGASSESFTAVAAVQDLTVTQSGTEVETTTKDDSGRRTLLDDRTLISMSITGTAIFTDDQTLADLRTNFTASTLNNYQVDMVSTDATTSGGTYEGAFQITQFEESAPNAGTIAVSITLESSGEVTFT